MLAGAWWFVLGLFIGATLMAFMYRDAALVVKVCPKCGRRYEP